MKFYSDEKFCVVDILFWTFITIVFLVCVAGVLTYFGN